MHSPASGEAAEAGTGAGGLADCPEAAGRDVPAQPHSKATASTAKTAGRLTPGDRAGLRRGNFAIPGNSEPTPL